MKRLSILLAAAILSACNTAANISQTPVMPATAPIAAGVSDQTPATKQTTATTPATAGAGNAAALQVWVDDLDLTNATQGWKNTNKNLSAEENPVTLKGKTFAHAVGTHPNGLIVIDLKGAAKRFTATIGIDDDSEDQGAAGFTVIGDGKVLFHSGTMTSADPVKQVSVDLTGLQQLVLQVDSGDDENINYDHTEWAEPLISLDPAKAGAKIVTVPASQAKLP